MVTDGVVLVPLMLEAFMARDRGFGLGGKSTDRRQTVAPLVQQ